MKKRKEQTMTYEEIAKRIGERVKDLMKARARSIRLTKAAKAKIPPSFSG